ncbi:MAG: hypothetical protein J5621_04480 [Paludibacteraceae bacterium]|nr:hypothetical protein [Paludibacteraceae bacterium]
MSKKVFILFAVAMMAANLFAQEVVSPEQFSQQQSVVLERHGNTYFYGRDAMTQRQMLDWYAQHNCQAAYLQFSKGQKMATAGWACLGVAAGCHVGLWTCYGMFVFGDNYDGIKLLQSAYGLAVGAGAFTAACIPLLIVGHRKMHNSVDIYNSHCDMAKVQPYWSLQASNNGLGLALNF